MFPRIALLSVMLLAGQLGMAQYGDSFIRGTLLDSKTKEPVVFATVRLQGKALGVISNMDGGFQIPAEFQQQGEALVISSMGYITKRIAFSELEENRINTIYLEPEIFELTEAVVEGRKRRKPSAKEILRYAFDQIPNNYPNEPFDLVGYYRDYQLKDDQYINLNESLIRVLDQGFKVDDYQSIEFGLYRYFRNKDFAVDSFAAKPYDDRVGDKVIPNARLGNNYTANELVLLFIHDAIRNHGINAYSYVYTLVEDFIDEHSFDAVENTSYGDQKVYKINFKKQDGPIQVQGTIYVDENSYAIRKLDYTAFEFSRNEDGPPAYNADEKDLLFEILVEYQELEDRMYLNYISFHNQFKLVRPPKFAIDSLALNPTYRTMRTFLNKPPANWSEMKPGDFQVYYKGKRLRLHRVIPVVGAPDELLVVFPRNNSGQKKLIRMLFSDSEDSTKSSLRIIANKLTDARGNRLGERKTERIDQFREFFTQQLDTGRLRSASDRPLVNKFQSLGNPAQPLLEASFEQDYWMNTPLKTGE